MAGHSHASNVARRKNAVDAKRAKIWSKIAKKIMVAAKGGADPAHNLSLRYMVEEGKAANMHKDTIQKAIDKGSGNSGTENFESVTYEAYGPNGVAMIVEALTDNRARTAPDIRHMLDKGGGNLATTGAVSFVFTKKGVLLIRTTRTIGEGRHARTEPVSEEAVMEVALDAGAEDVTADGGMYEVLTAPADFLKVKEALEKANFPIEDAQITNLPNSTVALDAEQSTKFTKLLDTLDDNDDVQNVYHNAELTG
jgi:YebC/PmpR family DNA-binding regulatory protein